MKRISMVLLGLILFCSLAMAQITSFSQLGVATQGLRADGLSMAHTTLPINSKAMVVNVLTGKEIEVTVVGRMPQSPSRIADLSPAAWQELGLQTNGEVRIYTAVAARPRPAEEQVAQEDTTPEQPPPPVVAQIIPAEMTPDPPVQPAPSVPAAQPPPVQPTPIVPVVQPAPVQPAETDPEILRRLRALEDWKDEHNRETELDERFRALEARQGARETTTSVVLHVHPQAAQPAPVFVPMPQVIPGMPDLNSGRNHRLQVGAYSSRETADIVARQVAAAGFQVVRELSGQIHRVIATDVPASMVPQAVQRLAAIGINQIWIRE